MLILVYFCIAPLRAHLLCVTDDEKLRAMFRNALGLKEPMMVDIDIGEELEKAGLAKMFPIDSWPQATAVCL